jgi:hypothetical protein
VLLDQHDRSHSGKVVVAAKNKKYGADGVNYIDLQCKKEQNVWRGRMSIASFFTRGNIGFKLRCSSR